MQTPFKLGAVSVTSTGTQLNYLNAASGTTGTGSVVFATAPTLSALTVTANSTSNNFISAGFTTVSSGTLITLTSASPRVQRITGSSTQTIQLPAANTLSLSWTFEINNNSSGAVTVNDGAAGFLFTVPGGGYAVVFCIASFTVAGAWDWHFEVPANVQWGTSGLVGYAKSGANSDITSLTGLNGVIQAPTAITDVNGVGVLGFLSIGSAVNYLRVSNAITSGVPALLSFGTDTNVDLGLVTKGTGKFVIDSEALTNQISVNTGTSFAHTTNLNFPSTAQIRTVTFPDADFTIATAGANSNITSLTGLNGVIRAPTAIADSNGNTTLEFSYIISPQNHLAITGSVSGQNPGFFAKGGNTDIGMQLTAKNAGIFNLVTTATSSQIRFNTNNQTTFFSFPNNISTRTVTFPDASGTLCMDTSSSGSLTTAPPVSASSTLAVGTAYQNTLGHDIVLTVYLSVTAATTASILLGVGTTTTPTQQTIVSSLTTAAIVVIPVTIYLPNNYYALLSTSGTITQTISGQQAMAV